MAIIIKSDKEIEIMRKAGKILAEILDILMEIAEPGMSTLELDQVAEKLILERDAVPGFKGYQGFPATLCTAVNEVIVHGIPKKDEILKEGDLLTVDCGVIYQGMYSDSARSIGIGKISKEKEELIETAYRALYAAIDIAKPGVHLGEISKTIGKTITEAGFYVIPDLTGHGVGSNLHEDPIIPNYDDGNRGPILKKGMTLAIEPIFSSGTNQMVTLED